MEKKDIKNLINDIKEDELDKTATFTDLVSKRQYKKIKKQEELDKTIKIDPISEEEVKKQIIPVIDNKDKLDEINDLYDNEFIDSYKTSPIIIFLGIILLICSILFISYNILYKSLLNQPLDTIINYSFISITGFLTSLICITKNKVKDFILGLFILVIIGYIAILIFK